MALSPDGSMLAGGGRDRTMLWDLASRTLIGSLDGPKGRVLDVAFAHDGNRVATAGEGDHAIRLYEVPSRRHIRSFQGHSRDVRSVKFVADDSLLVSCSDDLTIRTWAVVSGSQQDLGLGHTEGIWGLSVSPDGQTTVSASADRSIKVWDGRSLGSHSRLPIGQPAAFVFTSDSRTLVTLEVSPWCLALGCGNRNSHWPNAARSEGRRHSVLLLLAGCPAAGHRESRWRYTLESGNRPPSMCPGPCPNQGDFRRVFDRSTSSPRARSDWTLDGLGSRKRTSNLLPRWRSRESEFHPNRRGLWCVGGGSFHDVGCGYRNVETGSQVAVAPPIVLRDLDQRTCSGRC